MNKILTKRQALILFACLIISFKVQRLPALLCDDFGRDSYIALALFFAIDFLVLIAVLAVYKKMGDCTIYEYIDKNAGKFWLIVFCVLTIVFFMFKGVIAYKQIHEFFANTLFNRLPWKYFGFIFIALLIVMIGNGLKNIGRSAELYVYLMAFCIVSIVLLGIFSADYLRLLPILDIDINESAPNLIKYSCWFFDPILLLYFGGRVEEDEKHIKKGYVLTHIICAVFVIIGTATFYAVNEYMVGFQSNGLTALTEHSLIKLGIGRPDWFLVLFVNIANIIVASVLLFLVAEAFSKIIGKKVNYFVSAGIVISVYLWDEFLYRNLEITIMFTTKYVNFYMWVFGLLLPLLLLIVPKRKSKNTNQGQPLELAVQHE